MRNYLVFTGVQASPYNFLSPHSDVPIENAAFFPDVRKAGTVVYYREGDEGLSLAQRWVEAVHPSPVGPLLQALKA